jgi:hypothetical protein
MNKTIDKILFNRRSSIIFVLILIVLSGGCIGPFAQNTPTADLVELPTETIPPTPTDTPVPLAPVGVLLSTGDADPNLSSELTPLIAEKLKAEGLRYQERQSMTVDDFSQDVYQLVVVLSPYPELQTLAAASPGTKFLAVGFSDLEPAVNLHVIQPGQDNFGVQGFIAGYIAAMITTDWRVGALAIQEFEGSTAAREGFVQGARYFCGLCNPKYAPTGVNYLYPKFIDLPADATDLEIQANVQLMLDRAVKTFYLAPGAGTPQILSQLAAGDAKIIASGGIYQEEYQDNWVATLDFDLVQSFEDYWPEFISSEEGGEFIPPLLITNVNPEFLSPGKLEAAERIMSDVSSGLISTTQGQ